MIIIIIIKIIMIMIIIIVVIIIIIIMITTEITIMAVMIGLFNEYPYFMKSYNYSQNLKDIVCVYILLGTVTE